MKIEIWRRPGRLEGDVYFEQEWSWIFRADNGAPIGRSVFSYRRRTDAIHGALLVTGLRLPPRSKGIRSQMCEDFPMPRGGFGNVYVDYGAGGMVKYVQWLVETELIELVEA